MLHLHGRDFWWTKTCCFDTLWTYCLRRLRTRNDWSTMSDMQKILSQLCRCRGYLRMKIDCACWNLDSVFFVPTVSYPGYANYSDSIAGLNLFSAKMKHNALRLKWIKLYQKLGLPLLLVVIFLGLSCYLYLNSLSSLKFWKCVIYFESSFPYISTLNFVSFAWISKNKFCKKSRVIVEKLKYR